MKNLIEYYFSNLQEKSVLLMLALAVLICNSCMNDDEVPISPNAIFFQAPRGGNVVTATVDTEGSSIPISVQAAKPVSSPVNITTGINEEALVEYNLANGTNYKVLPEQYYSLSGTDFLIDKDNFSSTLQTIDIKSLADLPDEDKYAIPITIHQVSGNVPLLDAAKDHIIIVNKVLYTSVPHLLTSSEIEHLDLFTEEELDLLTKEQLNLLTLTEEQLDLLTEEEEEELDLLIAEKINSLTKEEFDSKFKTSNSIGTTFKTPINDLSAFTLEWRCNIETFKAPNNDGYWNQSGIYAGLKNVTKGYIYTRLTSGTIQLKDGGTTYVLPVNFQGNRWYHFAVVYDGVNFMFYVDGEVTLSIPTAHTFGFELVGFGNGVGGSKMINEIRLWSVARSKIQLINNPFAVSPDSEGLEGYWKCDEGEGNRIKDHSKNGNDMIASSGKVKWVHNVRMPAKDQ